MKIRNWEELQHFKNRTPPWIKLYRRILEDRDINSISDCAFRVLVGCWLLASEDKTHEGVLPDIEDIAFRLRKPKSLIVKTLKELDKFITQDDIALISEGCQGDTPEREKERETKKEGEEEKDGSLSLYFIEKISASVGRELLCTKASCRKWISKLLKKGIGEDEIISTIDWLATDNLKREYKFVVQSGKSLYEKWDRIKAAMSRDDKPKDEYHYARG